MNEAVRKQTTIVVNGEAVEVRARSLSQVLEALGYDLAHAAVALNEEIVFRRDLATTTVTDGDRVEVVGPMSGG